MESKDDISWNDIEFDNEEQIDYYLELLKDEVNKGIFDKLKEIKKKLINYKIKNEQLIEPGYIFNIKGKIYYYGEKVKKNYPKSIQLFEQAIELGNSHAMNNLAIIYKCGICVEQNSQKAIQLFEQAIQLNNYVAMISLGCMYEDGLGIERNYEKAVEVYEQAVEVGNSHAMNKLAYMYKVGKGVEISYEKAIDLYEQAIQLNDSHAIYNLGIMYEQGVGVKQDYNRAIELYKQSKQLGNISAHSKLFTMYNCGKGVKQNIINFLKYFIKILYWPKIKEARVILRNIKQNIEYYETQLMTFQQLNYNKNQFEKLKNKFKAYSFV